VPGADLFYGELGGGHTVPPGELRPEKRIPATHRPFFYVSSSPWNLFSYIVAFQRAKGLPLGPLLLRDWGFNRATLAGGSHGDHKRAAANAYEHYLVRTPGAKDEAEILEKIKQLRAKAPPQGPDALIDPEDEASEMPGVTSKGKSAASEWVSRATVAIVSPEQTGSCQRNSWRR